MKNINKISRVFGKKLNLVLLFLIFITIIACDPTIDSLSYELPEANSQEDLTPPSANFEYSQGAGDATAWMNYTFANTSLSATTYFWDFGNGDTSTDIDGATTYPGEGTFTVTLTASDNLGVENTYSETIEVIEPDAPAVPDPVLVNYEFDKLPKSSGSDCSCAAWINKDIGEQGESSSGNGSDVVKFDNNEPDHVYQEFEVVPNSDYLITLITSFKSIGTTVVDGPSSLELRILAGSGYTSGYTPVYYTNTVDFPQGNTTTGQWGYTTVSQVEDPANNLFVTVRNNPNDTGYLTSTYAFNSGANDSVALFIRGIGGNTGGLYGYNSGDEEIRADSVVITAIN